MEIIQINSNVLIQFLSLSFFFNCSKNSAKTSSSIEPGECGGGVESECGGASRSQEVRKCKYSTLSTCRVPDAAPGKCMHAFFFKIAIVARLYGFGSRVNTR